MIAINTADIQINLDPGQWSYSYLSNTSYCVGMASNKPILQDLCCLYTRKRNKRKNKPFILSLPTQQTHIDIRDLYLCKQ